MEVTPAQIEAIIAPVLTRKQVKLCGIKVSGRFNKPLIQLFIDWEEAPITIEECVKISREVQDLFDIEERFAPDYRLEVSSPGLDAPITEPWQFRRNIGRTISFDRGAVRTEAVILDVDGTGLISLDETGETTTIRASEIIGAQVVLFPKKKILSKRKHNEARDR